MRTPELTRRLTLEARETAPDGGGGSVETWRALGEHWAEVLPVRGIERVVGGLAASEVTHRLTLRWVDYGAPARPAANQRFRDGARVYALRAVTEADARNQWLVAWATEGAA